jgi:hypothetical protein
MVLNLHFPEFPDHPRNGEPCRGLDDDTKVGDYLYVASIGPCVIVCIEGEDATLMLTGGLTPEEES